MDFPFRIPKGLSTKHPWEKLTTGARKAAVVLFTESCLEGKLSETELPV
jgi:hypothetical protein